MEKDEQVQFFIETILPIQGIASFYIMLVQDHKDPAYYGDIVTPNDPGLVLIRWKLAEDQYRVIFGDLQTKTVTAAELTELEANLPQ
jgi:hypothetical protein